MQFVEITLDPHEAVIAEAGGMMYMWKPSSATEARRDQVFLIKFWRLANEF